MGSLSNLNIADTSIPSGGVTLSNKRELLTVIVQLYFWSNKNYFICSSSPSFTITNHVATVCLYMNKCKDSSDAHRLKDSFSRYIVASCWKKMRQRISQWFSLGLIFHLHDMDDDTVLLAYDDSKSERHHAQISSTRTDRALAITPTNLSPREFQNIVSYYPARRLCRTYVQRVLQRRPRTQTKWCRLCCIVDLLASNSTNSPLSL